MKKLVIVSIALLFSFPGVNMLFADGVDTTPDPFTFTDRTDVALNTEYKSNAITVSGITSSTSISVTGGTYSINGGAYTSASGSVNLGNTVKVRKMSAAAYSTTKSATLNIGGVSDTFSVTTHSATNPDPFTFTDRTNVALNTEYKSNAITVSDLGAAAPISITDGTYSINGAVYTSAGGTVVNGNTVKVKKMSAAAYSMTTNTTLTIGGVSDIFSLTTLAEMQIITFMESYELFPNPERGWISHRYSSNAWGLSDLRSSGYKASIILLKVDLSGSKSLEHIDPATLSQIEDALNQCRNNGIKTLVLCAYNFDGTGSPEPKLARILNHIADMRDILFAFQDVIFGVEVGWLGPWGEYHTSRFGAVIPTDISTQIIDAQLNNMPEDMMVMMRRPYYIREVLGTVVPLPDSEAYSTAKRARIGYYNDGYLTNATDAGTYVHGLSRSQELDYVHQQCKYTFFGGETFGTPNGEWNNFVNAMYESEYMHMTYLHKDYYTPIYDAWGQDGKDTFTRRLGYRFVLDTLKISSEVKPGGVLHVELAIRNVGFASPHRERPVELVLTNGVTTLSATVSVDPRRWDAGGTINIVRNFRIPANIATGYWDVHLNLPDRATNLKSDARYAIRFANTDIWQPSSGYNTLFQNLHIHENVPGSSTDDTVFAETGAP